MVQTNNLGIPGLVTSTDKIYRISCDYSAVNDKTKKTFNNLNVE